MKNLKLPLIVPALLFLLILSGCGSDAGPGEEENQVTFNSGFLGPGDTYSFTFEQEGTYDYYCTTHAPDMTGRIIVSQEATTSERDTVIMQNMQFVPSQVTVAPNTEIVWVNREDETVEEHTVTSGTPSGGGGGY